jgi:hypothetical protein
LRSDVKQTGISSLFVDVQFSVGRFPPVMATGIVHGLTRLPLRWPAGLGNAGSIQASSL